MTNDVVRSLTLEEYGRQVAQEKSKRATLARDLFLFGMLFLVGSGAAFYYEWPVVAAGLFVVFMIVQSVASETRLEIAMLDANRLLAQLVHQQSSEIELLRQELKQEQFLRTR